MNKDGHSSLHRKGLLIVLSAPAGTGKTTLVHMLTQEFNDIEQSVSCTTRVKRLGEQDGKDYHFISQKAFDKHVRDGDFLEHAHLFGASYGTLHTEVQGRLLQGKSVILVIDTQGAFHIKETGCQAIYIFVAPTSVSVLQERLEKRDTETLEQRKLRLELAEKEMKAGEQYDYWITNDELSRAYAVLKSIIIAEKHKIDKEGNSHG